MHKYGTSLKLQTRPHCRACCTSLTSASVPAPNPRSNCVRYRQIYTRMHGWEHFRLVDIVASQFICACNNLLYIPATQVLLTGACREPTAAFPHSPTPAEPLTFSALTSYLLVCWFHCLGDYSALLFLFMYAVFLSGDTRVTRYRKLNRFGWPPTRVYTNVCPFDRQLGWLL